MDGQMDGWMAGWADFVFPHAAASVPICSSLGCPKAEGCQECLKRVLQPQGASDAGEDASSFHVLL